MAYKSIPVKPDLFRDLKEIKTEAEKKVGTSFDWNSFILGVLGGAAGTSVGFAIAEAIKKWKEKKGSLKDSLRDNKP